MAVCKNKCDKLTNAFEMFLFIFCNVLSQISKTHILCNPGANLLWPNWHLCRIQIDFASLYCSTFDL